jgi:hypothetical protein
VPLARAWEHLRLSFYTLLPSADTVACIFGRGLTQTQRSSLRAGSTCISQSSAGPIDGAGDGIKMDTSGLLCEACFSRMSLSTRRHCGTRIRRSPLSGIAVHVKINRRKEQAAHRGGLNFDD